MDQYDVLCVHNFNFNFLNDLITQSSLAKIPKTLTWVKIALFAQNSFPDTAQRGTLYAKVRGNMIQGNIVENIGVVFNEVQVSLFRRFKKKTFRSFHGDIESFLG